MKKLMLLGGSAYLLPVIEKAHELGVFVITCDYLPDNIAHGYSDCYCNLSVMDKEGVLQAAIQNNIDGIMSFACDPGVVTAAYVAERMGLPFQCPYESARILQDKGLFRAFLNDNGFTVPHAKRYENKNRVMEDLEYFNWPVIVKPTDSAGSKGVTRVDSPADLYVAIEIALSESHCESFVVEDFITFKGYHSDADPFSIDGKVAFMSYSDQLFDKNAANPYTPSLIIWPSTMESDSQDELTRETQRLFELLNMKTGIFNIETCVGADGKNYLMEVSPRGGGCRIAELQELIYGIPFVENEIRKALGMEIVAIDGKAIEGHWCEMVVHSKPGQSGILKKIVIDDVIERQYIVKKNISAKVGDEIKPFSGANMAMGDIFLHFNTREELDEIMSKVDEWLDFEIG